MIACKLRSNRGNVAHRYSQLRNVITMGVSAYVHGLTKYTLATLKLCKSHNEVFWAGYATRNCKHFCLRLHLWCNTRELISYIVLGQFSHFRICRNSYALSCHCNVSSCRCFKRSLAYWSHLEMADMPGHISISHFIVSTDSCRAMDWK